MDDNEIEDLKDRADDLEHRITDKSAQVIQDLLQYQRRSRRLTNALMAVIAALVVYGIVLGFALIKVNHNANGISQAKQQAAFLAAVTRASCEADNVSKAKEANLWDFILKLPPPPDQTPEQAAQTEQFTAIVKDVYAPVDCSITPPGVTP